MLALQTDPYTVAPLWPDSISMAALQAGLDSGSWTAEQMAQVALDSFAACPRVDRVEPAATVAELLDRPLYADPLRRHDIAPITDGASAIVLASASAPANCGRTRPGSPVSSTASRHPSWARGI
ncbi:hypothetical protein MINS_00030 [Mycolicibacterium insubricum]|nr:hypothetical protein MINS_00030 [Mycolicibacterium insubricum]